MPILKQLTGDFGRLAIWKIEESEYFFKKEGLTDGGIPLLHRRLEYMTARYLLRFLYPEFPIANIQVNEHGKPFLPDSTLHFSISHSYPYVGVVIDKQPVGIDVQVYQEKIIRIRHKFLSAAEQNLFHEDPKQLTIAWAAKEAAFKWSVHNKFNFIAHLPIEKYHLHFNNADIVLSVKRTQPTQILSLEGAMEKDFAWMVTKKVRSF